MLGSNNLSKCLSPSSEARPDLFRPQFPYHMVWLATNACNARCVHCSTNATTRRAGELTTQEAKEMFDQLAAIGVFDMAISGGEALLRHDIFEILEHATNLGIRLGLGSNGSTITRNVVNRLKSLGLDRLQISIDGAEETHDKARCWKGLFQKSARAITLGIDGGLHVHVCFTAHQMNYGELAKVVDQCVKWGVRRFNLSRFVPTGRGDSFLDLTPQEWKDVAEVFEAKRNEYAGQIEFTTHLAQLILLDADLDCKLGFIGCQAGLGQGCIGPEGEVTPCVMLPTVIGNIREKPFQEIWNASPLIKSLQGRSGLKGWCGECFYREKCGGCRAVAYSYTGDYLAADPRCWLYANLDELPKRTRPVAQEEIIKLQRSS